MDEGKTQNDRTISDATREAFDKQLGEELSGQFIRLIEYCLATPELVSNFDRLHGTSIGKRKSPINQMIDDAAGKTQADMVAFADFVKEYIWPVHLQHLAEEFAREVKE